VQGSGVIVCRRQLPPPGLASYALGVETLTFLFTDIEGSTVLLARLGDDGYARVLAGHHALIRSALAAHGGREVDTQGDAFFAVFSSPRGCVAAVANLTGPGQGKWLARLDADQANLRRAAEYAAGRPDGTAVVLRLGVALDRYWWARSRLQEAFGLLVPVLRRPGADADPALFAAALVTATGAAFFIDLATARQLAEQAVQVARRLGDERLLSTALAALCAGCTFAGEPETGRPFGYESVERARRLGDDVLLAEALRQYLLSINAIDPARALPLYTEAIACTERSGDHFINSRLNNNAGWAALVVGDIPAARAHLEAAAQAVQQIGWEDASVQESLGDVLRAERDLDGARFTFEAALRISRRNGDTWNMAYAILGLALLAGDAGDWDRAATLHGVAQAFQDRTGNPWQELAARDRRDSLDQARAHMGDEHLDLAYAQGMALSLDKALDLALPRAGPV
jgi:class 3 adenylate cyclase